VGVHGCCGTDRFVLDVCLHASTHVSSPNSTVIVVLLELQCVEVILQRYLEVVHLSSQIKAIESSTTLRL
jgi:hypothetical protein